jgi:hypothetical protein
VRGSDQASGLVFPEELAAQRSALSGILCIPPSEELSRRGDSTESWAGCQITVGEIAVKQVEQHRKVALVVIGDIEWIAAQADLYRVPALVQATT